MNLIRKIFKKLMVDVTCSNETNIHQWAEKEFSSMNIDKKYSSKRTQICLNCKKTRYHYTLKEGGQTVWFYN